MSAWHNVAATLPECDAADTRLTPERYPTRAWVLGSLALAQDALGEFVDAQAYEAWWREEARREGTPAAWRRWPSSTVAEVLFGSFSEALRLARHDARTAPAH
jgi:hypothetical protein